MAVDARADGVIERETNTITIEGQGFSLATLYLNDELVDLDKPVRVVCNGVETSGLLPRRLSTALDLLVDGTSDANCVYVVEASFDASGEPPPATDEHADGSDSEFDGRFAAAGDDVVLLWDLVQWCRDNQREARVEPVLRKLVRLSPDHESARLALGQEQAHGLWFATPWARQRFEAGQDEATARQRGYVKYRSLWVHPGDRPNHGKGLTKDPMTGQWLALADQKRIAAGWARQDLEWIEPEQAASADAGLWRVQGEWLDLQAANRRHARIDSMWHIPGPEVLLHTTVDRAVALQAAFAMERAIDDLRRVFGAEPELPLEVAVLRDEEQYDRFAFGDPDGLRRATHAGRLHAIHSAYFAESWFPRVEAKPTFGGLGVCYWDAQVPNGNLYGVHSARLAVGLSYVEALDPSPKAVRKALSSGPTAEYYQAYQDEKQLPAWLRHGGAVYAERFFRDDFVAEGNDPWWARQWSLDNLRSRGGLRSLDEVFAFELDADDREGSLKLLIEAGLLVAFAVDGACEPVSAAHEQLKAALAAGSSPTKAIAALREAIAGNESQLRAFAGQE